MDRKEKIINYINSENYVPLKLDEMSLMLDVPNNEKVEFEKILNELVIEGRVFLTKKFRYAPVNKNVDLVAGILKCYARSGIGFVQTEDEEIFISSESMGMAYDKDTVLVRITKKKKENNHREGRIERVLHRGNDKLVGIITGIKNGKYRVTTDRREFFAQIRVYESDLNGAKIGDRVFVKIMGYNDKNKPMGVVEVVLGPSDSLKSCFEGMLAESGIPSNFSEEVITAADKLPQTVGNNDIKNREDLRDKKIFTIDGDDSRDFDDAVSLEDMPNGNQLLGVHIADVTHYVKDGDAVDTEAFRRATSVYFPHKVIPMLPKSLSNGICSLNPDVDRLTLSVFMEVDGSGSIVNSRMSETVIHSVARMTYNNVNKILAGDTKLREEYNSIVVELEKMEKLAEKMSALRTARGAIDFDFPEAKIKCDEDGNPIDVEIDVRGKSQKLIEQFMLSANETVAETAFWAEIPFVYRVHDAPSIEKITAFNDFIKNLGLSLKGKIDEETIYPKDIQMILDKVKGTPEEMMVSRIALRSLMKAAYRDTNDGHFGLAAKYYCHFTSPIRRYPDLQIHRILKEFINGKLNKAREVYYIPVVKQAAFISSDREIVAEKAERDADDLLKAAYMQQFLGDSFEAVISSITSFGMFATLANSCEGLIRCENMLADYFEYKEEKHILIGRRTGKIYRIGDKIDITVAACNLVMRNIDFVLKDDARLAIFDKIDKRNREMNMQPEQKKKEKRKSDKSNKSFHKKTFNKKDARKRKKR